MNSPSSSHHSKVRDGLLYALTFGLLYVSIGFLLSLLFDYVDAMYPDQVYDYWYTSLADSIRLNISVLFVLFPLYLGFTWFLKKYLATHPDQKDFWVRKIALYLTLILAGVTLAVDLITLIYHFLDGELSLRFFWKVFVVLVLAAGVFGYYFRDLRSQASSQPSKKILAAVLIVFLGVLSCGFFIIGSPFTQRLRKLDEQRVNDLSQIQGSILNYWQHKGKVPAKLDDLRDDFSGYQIPRNPEEKGYEYRVLDFRSFSLCANFSLPSDDLSLPRYAQSSLDTWSHKDGPVCFKRTIDPDLYPLQK
jgi:hypothetical protein